MGDGGGERGLGRRRRREGSNSEVEGVPCGEGERHGHV
jgi:hypothetical protein